MEAENGRAKFSWSVAKESDPFVETRPPAGTPPTSSQEMTRSRRPRVLLFAAWLAAVAASGCSEWSTFCSDKMDCLSGNAHDVDACVTHQEAEEDRASVKGCDKAWNDLAQCEMDHFTCKSGQFTDQGACDAKSKAYEQCMD